MFPKLSIDSCWQCKKHYGFGTDSYCEVCVQERLAGWLAPEVRRQVKTTLEMAWFFIEALTSDDPAYSSHIEPPDMILECGGDCPQYLREIVPAAMKALENSTDTV